MGKVTATPEITCFPNPTQGVLNIRLAETLPQNFKIIVCNCTGAIVFVKCSKSGQFEKTIPLFDLSTGVYKLFLTDENGLFIQSVSFLKN